MDGKTNYSYSLNVEFDAEYSRPMQLCFSTNDPDAFDQAQRAVAAIMASFERLRLCTDNEERKP